MSLLGTVSISLKDLNDAIVAGVAPLNPAVGTLWIDNSGATNVLKVYQNGNWETQTLDTQALDVWLKDTIKTVTDTLGTIANDNKLTLQDRQLIVDNLTPILGTIPSTATAALASLPTYQTLDSNGSGTFATYRKSAISLGLTVSDSVYTSFATAYTALASYLGGLTFEGIAVWDVRTVNKDVVLDVAKDAFRQKWLDYYTAEQAIMEAILKVPGPAGAPAVVATLTNEADMLPAYADGTVASYTGAATTMQVMLGDEDDSDNWVVSVLYATPGLTGSLPTTGTPMEKRTYTVSSMAVDLDSGYVDLQATRSGYQTLTKRFSITKNKQGADGSPLIDRWMETSAVAIGKDVLGNFSPSAVTVSAKEQTGGAATVAYLGKFILEESTDGEYFTTSYTSTANESSIVYIPGETTKLARVTLYESISVATVIDTQHITIVSDGLDGEPGGDAIVADLSNEQVVIATDAAGLNGSYGGAASTLSIYEAATDVSGSWTVTATVSKDGSNNPTVTGSFNAATRTYTVTGLLADTGYVDFEATRTGYQTLTKRFTLSKSRKGGDAVSYWVTTGTSAISKSASGVLSPNALTAAGYKQVANGTPEAFTGTFTVSTSTDGNSFSVVETKANMATMSYTVPTNVVAIRIDLYADTAKTTWLDGETVRVVSDGLTLYTWKAYANSLDGQLDFSRTVSTSKRFVGLATNRPTPTDLINANGVVDVSMYTWTPLYDNVQVGGVNLILGSKPEDGPIVSTTYRIHEYTLSEDIIAGEEYTISLRGLITANHAFGLWQNPSLDKVGDLLYDATNDIYHLTFIAHNPLPGRERKITLYNVPDTTDPRTATIHWAQLEKGNIYTTFARSPEDLAAELSQLKNDTLSALEDKMLNATEKASVRQTLQLIATEKADIESKYSAAIASPKLPQTGTEKDTGERAALESAMTAYSKDTTNPTNGTVTSTGAYKQLTDAILAILSYSENEAISAYLINEVTTNFTAYREAYVNFHTALNKAQTVITNNAIADGVAIVYSDFYTKTEFDQRAADIEANATKSGGVNLVENSVHWIAVTAEENNAADSHWTLASGTVKSLQDDSLSVLGFGSGFEFQSTRSTLSKLDQTVYLPRRGRYTLSFYVNKMTAAAGDKVGIDYTLDGATTHLGVPTNTTTAGYTMLKVNIDTTTAAAQELTLSIVASAGVRAVISGIMLNEGDLALAWQAYPSEVYNTNVKIDINGIRVRNNQLGQEGNYTLITPNEFAGHAIVNAAGTLTDQVIFTLNGKVTELEELKVKGNKIEMAPISIRVIDNGTNKGWAFV